MQSMLFNEKTNTWTKTVKMLPCPGGCQTIRPYWRPMHLRHGTRSTECWIWPPSVCPLAPLGGFLWFPPGEQIPFSVPWVDDGNASCGKLRNGRLMPFESPTAGLGDLKWTLRDNYTTFFEVHGSSIKRYYIPSHFQGLSRPFYSRGSSLRNLPTVGVLLLGHQAHIYLGLGERLGYGIYQVSIDTYTS